VLSDEELERSINGFWNEMTEDEVRLLAREYPPVFIPEILERWPQLAGKQRGE